MRSPSPVPRSVTSILLVHGLRRSGRCGRALEPWKSYQGHLLFSHRLFIHRLFSHRMKLQHRNREQSWQALPRRLLFCGGYWRETRPRRTKKLSPLIKARTRDKRLLAAGTYSHRQPVFPELNPSVSFFLFTASPRAAPLTEFLWNQPIADLGRRLETTSRASGTTRCWWTASGSMHCLAHHQYHPAWLPWRQAAGTPCRPRSRTARGAVEVLQDLHISGYDPTRRL